MMRWAIGVALAVVAVGVSGCGERQTVAPSVARPQFELTVVPACDINAMNPLVTHYFSSDDAKTVRGLINAIQAAGAGTATARDRGFDIMALIAANAAAGTGGSVQHGSDLMNEVTKCMLNDGAEFPETFPEDYTIPLTTAQAGGIGVRGGASDPATDAVYSRDLFSGVAPPMGVTWAAMLSGNPAPARLLVYGHPGSTAQTYDWKVLPRNTAFDPHVIVGVCVDVTAEPTSMLHEEHVGILTFADAYFLDPVTCGSVSMRNAPWPTQLAHGLGRLGSALFLPRTLAASSAVNRGGIGGSTGGIGSEFGLNDIPTANIAFTVQPPATVMVGQPFSVQLMATDPATGATMGGVQLSIVAVNNNGTRKLLQGSSTQTTSNAGVATFSGLSFDPNSTGGFRLVVAGSVLGRHAIQIADAVSNKVNSRPAK